MQANSKTSKSKTLNIKHGFGIKFDSYMTNSHMATFLFNRLLSDTQYDGEYTTALCDEQVRDVLSRRT